MFLIFANPEFFFTKFIIRPDFFVLPDIFWKTVMTNQGKFLDRKKLMADPIMMVTIIAVSVFLLLFILYPLVILLADSAVVENSVIKDGLKETSTSIGFGNFIRIFKMSSFRKSIVNTLWLGFVSGIGATAIGFLFAYVDSYVDTGSVFVKKLFSLVSVLPVVSPPFVLSLSAIFLFGRTGLVTRTILNLNQTSLYGWRGIALVQIMTFFPVCYLMLKGLLKNIDPSLEEAARNLGAGRFQVFKTVTLPLLLPDRKSVV